MFPRVVHAPLAGQLRGRRATESAPARSRFTATPAPPTALDPSQPRGVCAEFGPGLGGVREDGAHPAFTLSPHPLPGTVLARRRGPGSPFPFKSRSLDPQEP